MQRRKARFAANLAKTRKAKARWPNTPWKFRRFLDGALNVLKADMEHGLLHGPRPQPSNGPLAWSDGCG